MITKNVKIFLQIASLMMVLNIAIGAFGAHGLRPYLDEYGTIIYNKGVAYSFYNTLGLFAIAFMSYLLPESTKLIKGYYFILAGILIFSFSLYILSLTKILWLGAITPIGGTAMIIGWILVFLGLKIKG
ncbi:MAG: DUF423 domain-containing protein [Arcobacteraceae bacterium]|nr:DUF423 domain-containing protein [Arcobacteraceae bacterium]